MYAVLFHLQTRPPVSYITRACFYSRHLDTAVSKAVALGAEKFTLRYVKHFSNNDINNAYVIQQVAFYYAVPISSFTIEPLILAP